jgi:transcription termination factor Rho
LADEYKERTSVSDKYEAMLLPELRKIASELGVERVTGVKKSELVAKIMEKSQDSSAVSHHGSANRDNSTVSQEVGARLTALGMDSPAPAQQDNSRDQTKGDTSRDQDRRSGGESLRDDDDSPQTRRNRRRRNRDRQNRRRPGVDRMESEPQVQADDVLAPVRGIVDVMEGYAFVRTTGYLSSPEDAYMPLGMVRKYSLRKGDLVTGSIRLPKEGERKDKISH